MRYRIVISQETDPDSPRDWDNIATLVCWHSRHRLGDSHPFASPSDFTDWYHKQPGSRDGVLENLYLYDHSGITIRTTPFSDPWDSGQVGYAYILPETLLKTYKRKRMSAKLHNIGGSIIEGEVEVYDHYLTGQCWGFELFESPDGITWKSVDACSGFYGPLNPVDTVMTRLGIASHLPWLRHHTLDTVSDTPDGMEMTYIPKRRVRARTV